MFCCILWILYVTKPYFTPQSLAKPSCTELAWLCVHYRCWNSGQCERKHISKPAQYGSGWPCNVSIKRGAELLVLITPVQRSLTSIVSVPTSSERCMLMGITPSADTGKTSCWTPISSTTMGTMEELRSGSRGSEKSNFQVHGLYLCCVIDIVTVFLWSSEVRGSPLYVDSFSCKNKKYKS